MRDERDANPEKIGQLHLTEMSRRYRFRLFSSRNLSRRYDRVRGAHVGVKKIKLHYIDEVYTSEHWIVRIYKVRKQVIQRQRKGERDGRDGRDESEGSDVNNGRELRKRS